VDGVDSTLELNDSVDNQAVALRVDLSRLLQELSAVHFRHTVIAADDDEFVTLAEDLERLGGAAGRDDLVPLELEAALERFEHERLVVDEKQAIHRLEISAAAART